MAARILGPAIFGLYAIGWAAFRLVELIAPLGFDMGVLRYGARFLNHNEDDFRSVLIQSVLTPFFFSLILAVVFYFSAAWLAVDLFNKPDLVYVFRFLSLAFPLSALLSVLGSVLRLNQVMKYSVIVQDLGQPLFAVILLVVFYLFSMRLTGVLLSDVLSYGVSVVIGLYYLKVLFPHAFHLQKTDFVIHRELYAFSLVTSLAGVFSTLIFWVDRFFVGYFFPPADVGIYQAMSQISVIFAVVLGGLNRIVLPMFANQFHKGQVSSVEEIFRIGTRWGFYLSAPILLTLSIAPNESLWVLYGPAYVRGAPVLLALILGQVFNLITGPVVPLLVLSGHQNTVLKLSASALFLNAALLWLLIPRHGLMGASIATSMTLAAFFIAALVMAKSKIDVWPYDRRFLKGVFAFMVSAALALFFHNLLRDRNPLYLLAIEVISITAAFAMVLLVLRLDQEDKELLRSLLPKQPFK